MDRQNQYKLMMKNSFNDQSKNEPWNDTVFIIGKEKKEYHGNKMFFAVFSPVFKSMLYQQKVESTTNKLVIADIIPQSFEFIRDFAYGLNPSINEENVVSILYASQKYKIECIKNDCIIFLKEFASTNQKMTTIDSILTLLHKLHSSGLKDLMIALSGSLALTPPLSKELINSDTFLKLPPCIINLLLSSDNFAVKEELIFEKCQSWAKNYSQSIGNNDNDVVQADHKIDITDDDIKTEEDVPKTEVGCLQLLKYQIRFAIMDPKYFNQNIIDTKMLTLQESLNFMRYFNDKTKDTIKNQWKCETRIGVCYDSVQTKIESKIEISKMEIEKLIEFVPKQYQDTTKWKLLYRASEQQFSGTKFHELCENKGPTIVIVQPTPYYSVFGGYTEYQWQKTANNWQTDASAFLFLLRKPKNSNNNDVTTPIKWTSKDGTNAIYDHQSYGPTFGDGHDLYLSNGCNKNISSYSNLGHLRYDAPNDKNLLAGTYKFKVYEYEVWHLSS